MPASGMTRSKRKSKNGKRLIIKGLLAQPAILSQTADRCLRLAIGSTLRTFVKGLLTIR